jgi:hypothetical protein
MLRPVYCSGGEAVPHADVNVFAPQFDCSAPKFVSDSCMVGKKFGEESEKVIFK